MPPSQAPTGWDVRLLAGRCQRWCGGIEGWEEGEQASKDQGMARDRLGRGKLQVGNRLEGTRLEGTRLEGNRPGNQQQMQEQKWQQQQRQNQVGGGGGGADGYPEPGVSGRPEHR